MIIDIDLDIPPTAVGPAAQTAHFCILTAHIRLSFSATSNRFLSILSPLAAYATRLKFLTDWLTDWWPNWRVPREHCVIGY